MVVGVVGCAPAEGPPSRNAADTTKVPAPVVVRVATFTGRIRRDPWPYLVREVRLAAALVAEGAAVAPPSPLLPPGPHAIDGWTMTATAFVDHVAKKGKVSPNEYRAFGYRAPLHLWADLKTKWRGLRMALGFPIPGTSPAIQQKRGLNRDATIFYKKGLLRGR